MNKDQSTQLVICPSCEKPTPLEYMDYNGSDMCEGCAQNTVDLRPANDLHGKGFTDNNNY